jgi:hypothetical protein
VYTSLQASSITVKSLHFAKINQDRIALLLLGDLKAGVLDGQVLGKSNGGIEGSKAKSCCNGVQHHFLWVRWL